MHSVLEEHIYYLMILKNFPVEYQSIKSENAFSQYRWPVSSDVYLEVANRIIDLTHSYTGCDDTSIGRDVYLLKYRDFLSEMLYTSYALITIDRLRKSGYTVISEDQDSFFNLLNDRSPISNSLLIKTRNKSFLRKVAGRCLDRYNFCLKTEFFYSSNPLLQQYMSDNHNRTSRIFQDIIVNGMPVNGISRKIPEQFRGVVADLADRVETIWKENDIERTEKASKYITYVLTEHIKIALYHSKKKLSEKNLKKKRLLIGTGGKYQNRLLSYFFLRDGGDVFRFDHGGERSLFFDRWWGINEFSFQNRFVTFGQGSKKRLIKNIKEKRILLRNYNDIPISIDGMISKEFHSIYKRCFKPKKEVIKNVMVVMTYFKGSKIIPGYQAPDFVYLFTIFQAISKLQSKGFHIILKKYPKGCHQDFPYLEKYASEISDEPFNSAMKRADAFVFVYTGTAFCEALMSSKPIVYLHTPHRVIDPWARRKLEDIICWIDIGDTEENNRTMDRMIEYLEDNRLNLDKREAFINDFFLS